MRMSTAQVISRMPFFKVGGRFRDTTFLSSPGRREAARPGDPD
jgi:hypothetical protein